LRSTIAAGRRQALAGKDFLAGLLFVAFGLLGLWLSRTLETGSAGAMEAGYFPRLTCGLLIVIGVVLVIVSLVRPSEPPERGRWRPLLMVSAACLAFALLLRPLGLVATLLVTIVLARFADRDVRVLPLISLAAILIAATVGIFVLALRVPIPLWPALF
jgi:Tripartite tricarboxylate transporter TctB family